MFNEVGNFTYCGKYVEDMIDFIACERGINTNDVCYFPPGSVSAELMTEQRRWQVLSIIERYIRSSKEFWIFESPDHYDSWWTQAELASLAYIYNCAPEQCPDIYICTVDDGRFVYRKAGDGFIQKLNEKHKKEMARFFSNSDPATVGYESVTNMMSLRKQPRFIQWAKFKMMRLAAESGIAGDIISGALEDLDFEKFLDSLQSHVYAEGFWQDYIINCRGCQEEKSRHTPHNSKHNFDFNAFLYSTLPGIKRITGHEYHKILSSMKWTCDNCKRTFDIIKLEDDHFIWWPVRMGKPTGPDGTFIEKRPLYSIKSN